MNVISFQVPKVDHESFRVEINEGPHMYNRLHQHKEIQLTFIERGFGTLIIDNYIGAFKEGDLFVIGSGQPHVFRNDESFFTHKKPNASKATTIFFDTEIFGTQFWQLPECNDIKLFFEKSHSSIQYDGPQKELLIEIIKTVVAKVGIKKVISFLELLDKIAGVQNCKLLTTNHFEKRGKDFDHSRLRNILDYTLQNFDQQITIANVAAIANLTPEAFCNYFKLRTNKTYVTYLNEIRIQKASQLLQSREDNIAILANQCGFNNLSNFNRIFKKIKQLTPLQYKQKMAQPFIG